MSYSPVRGDNSRTLASGLSYLQVGIGDRQRGVKIRLKAPLTDLYIISQMKPDMSSLR